MKINFNVMSKTALSALIASAAIVPTIAVPTASAAVAPVSDVVYDVNGQNTSIGFDNFSEAINAEVLTDLNVKYVKASNGKFYSFADFSEAVNGTDDLDQALQALASSNKDVAVDNIIEGTIDPSTGGIVAPEAPVEDFEVTDIAAINKTTVTVKLGATPSEIPTAEKFNVTVGSQKVEVTNVTGTNQDGVYDLSVDLDGKEGIVTVNGVASKEAVDYVGPSIAETVAQSATVFDVKFSEKVDKTEAEKVGNYTLRYAVGKATDFTLNSLAGAGNVQASAVLLEDGQTVRVTIVSVGNSVTTGFKNGGLEDGANYQVKVSNKVVDEAGNAASTAFGPSFKGTDVADSQAAKVLSSAYNASTGKLTLTFDKAIATVDESKVKLSAAGKDTVELTSLTGTPAGNTVEFDAKTLASDIAKLGNKFDVEYAAGAFADVNGNDVAAAKKAVSVAAGLQVTSAGYNEAANVLTVAFNDTIDISKLADAPEIKVAGQALPTGTKLVNKSNSNTLQFQLPKDRNADGKVVDANIKAVKALEDAARIQAKTEKGVIVVIDTTNTFFAVGSDTELTSPAGDITIEGINYVADETAPTVESVSIEGLAADDGTVTIKLSEPVLTPAGGLDGKDFEFNADGVKVASLTGVKSTEVSKYTDTLTFELGTDATSKAEAAKLFAIDTEKTPFTVNVAKDAIVDANDQKNALLKDLTVNMVGKNATETVVATATATATGAKVVTLSASASAGKISLDKVSAETASNYGVVPTAGGAAIAVEKSTYDATTQTITLYLKDTATAGKEYEITASNLKNQVGEVISEAALEGKFKATFTGTAAVATTDLASAIVAKDADQNGKFSAGDTLTFDFGTPINLNTAKASDFDVEMGTAAAAGTLGSAKLAVDGTKLVVTLASDSKVDVGNLIKLDAATTKITNVDGEKVSITATDAGTKQGFATVAAPETKAPEISKAVYYDANENGVLDIDDTIKVTFSSKVSAAEGDNLTDEFVFTAPGATYATELSADGLSATLKLTAVTDLVPGTSTINVNGTSGNVDLVGLWDTALTPSAKAITIEKSDVVKPEVQSATYVQKEDGVEQIVLQMSEKVNVKASNKTFADNFTVTDGIITGTDVITVDEKDASKLIVTLVDGDFISTGVTNIKVSLTKDLGITDANGNQVKYTGTNITVN